MSAQEFSRLCKEVISGPAEASYKVRAAFPSLSHPQRQKLALLIRKSSAPQPALLDLLTNQIPKTVSMNTIGKSASSIADLALLASSNRETDSDAFESAMNNLISRLDSLPIYQLFDYSKDIDGPLLSVYWTALDDSTLLAGPADPRVGTCINKLIAAIVPEKMRSNLMARVLQTYYSDAPACYKSSFYSVFNAGASAVSVKTSRQVVELILTDLKEFSVRAFTPPPKDSVYDSKSVDLTGEFTASILSSLHTLLVLLKSASQACIVSTVQSTISIILSHQRLRLAKKEPHFRVSCTSDILLVLHEILYACIVCGRLEMNGCAPVVAMRLFVNGVGSGDKRVSRACEGYVRGVNTVVSRGGFTWVNGKEEEVEAGDFMEELSVNDPFSALVRPEAVALKANDENEETEEVPVETEEAAEVVAVKEAVSMPTMPVLDLIVPKSPKRESPAAVEEEIPLPKRQKKLAVETMKEASDSEDDDINMAIVLDADSD